jgi:Protein of unknown function (DUF2817)/Multicopper oxidase
VTVLLVHAVNPYGFSNIRRVTEDDVDLNRNFQDFSKPLPENPRYSDIHDALVPSDWDGPARAKAETALKGWRDANGGMPAYQAVVAGGQYTFPDGMFFGGQSATWSNQTFRAIVKKHGAAAKRVGLIDVHSGLGPTGYLTSGVMKDTISMPRYSTAEIDFVADDPGPTFFHCHHQDHMDEGFAGLITYT